MLTADIRLDRIRIKGRYVQIIKYILNGQPLGLRANTTIFIFHIFQSDSQRCAYALLNVLDDDLSDYLIIVQDRKWYGCLKINTSTMLISVRRAIIANSLLFILNRIIPVMTAIDTSIISVRAMFVNTSFIVNASENLVMISPVFLVAKNLIGSEYMCLKYPSISGISIRCERYSIIQLRRNSMRI